MTARPHRVVLMTTAPEALVSFLSRQIHSLAAQGVEVHTITSPGLRELEGEKLFISTHHDVVMKRTIHPARDLLSLFRVWLLLRQIQPEIIQTHTPKAGLLGMIAACAARVPVRIYTINGLRIQVESSVRALILRMTERLACGFATEVICVSRSVRRFVIANRFTQSNKCRVLGDGGSHGVDTEKFNPQIYSSAERAAVRDCLGIPADAFVLGYIGRIVPAKGVRELAMAWEKLREKYPNLRLLLCGYCESEHRLDPRLLNKLVDDCRVHFTRDRVTDMPPIYAALDLAVLPTYCEGLPNVALEAGAMQVPIIATRVPGCVDAVRHGVTGLLVEARNHRALAQAIETLMEDGQRRERMGRAARDFVCRRFSESRVVRLILERYSNIMDRAAQSEVGGSVIACTRGEIAHLGD